MSTADDRDTDDARRDDEPAADTPAGDGRAQEAPVEGLRERKKRLTRGRLHRSALELTLEKGVTAVTVDAIAEAAEVSPRTFFNYFRSKESAILGLPDDMAESLVTQMRQRPNDEDPLFSAREVARPFIANLRHDTELQRLRRETYTAHPELSNGFLQAAAGVERAIAQVTLERLVAHSPGSGVAAPTDATDKTRGAEGPQSTSDDPTAGASPEMRRYAILVGMATVAAVRATLAARAHSDMQGDALVRFYDDTFEHVRAGLPDPRTGPAVAAPTSA